MGRSFFPARSLPLQSHISWFSHDRPAGLAAGCPQLVRTLLCILCSLCAGVVCKWEHLRNYKRNWGLWWCGWQVSPWPVNASWGPVSNVGGPLCIIHKEMRVAFIICLHSNMPIIAGYIYTHYSSVQREVSPLPLSSWGTALIAAAHIFQQVWTQTTSTFLGGKSKP